MNSTRTTGAIPLYEAIRERNAERLDAPALHDRRGTLIFRELFEAAEKLGSELNVSPGQGIALSLPNSRFFVIAMLAVLSRGGAVMPLSPNLTSEELEDVVTKTRPHGVITTTEAKEYVLGLGVPQAVTGGTLVDLRMWDAAPIVSDVPDPAFIRFTSGTTAASKGVLISAASTIERLRAASAALELSPSDTVVWVLPMAFHFVVSIVLYLHDGIPFALCEELSPDELLDSIAACNGTVLYASPATYLLLLSASRARRTTGLRRAFCTTSALSPDLAGRFRERFGLPIIQLLGIFELGLPLTNIRDAETTPEAVGRPAPGFETAILGSDGLPVPDGTVGKLAIRGPGMFDGYLYPSRPVAEVLVNGWFMTGDLATRSADGIVTIAGRSTSVINVAGNKIFPEEVEGVIQGFPGISQVRVFGKPHELWGATIHAQVVPESAAAPSEEFDLERLRRHCRERLSSFKVPHLFEIVREIPTTPSGKIFRRSSE